MHECRDSLTPKRTTRPWTVVGSPKRALDRRFWRSGLGAGRCAPSRWRYFRLHLGFAFSATRLTSGSWRARSWTVGRCRAEHLGRVHRVAIIEHAAGRRSDFQSRPWEIVYRDVTKDHAIWTDAVGRPALLFTTKISAVARLADSGFGWVTLGLEDVPHADKAEKKESWRRGLVRTRLRSLSRSPAPRARRAPGKGKRIDGRAPDGTHNRSCAHPRSQPSEAAQSLPNVPTAQ